VTADTVHEVLEEWAFLWDRRPALVCPSCHRVGVVFIRLTDGTLVCPECIK
jgi:hypothetical protein